MDNKDILRRSGISTRLMDNCVQELFNTGKCTVKESGDLPVKVTDYLLFRLKSRLKHEHGIIPDRDYLISSYNAEKGFTLSLRKGDKND